MAQTIDAAFSHFQVVNSNDLEVLSSVCAQIIHDHPLLDPLSKEIVLVMNSGMRTYLNQEIALKNKIASGIEYQQIWIFIWDLYKKIFNISDFDTLNCFSRDSIAWSLLGLVDEWGAEKKTGLKQELDIFKPLRDYIQNDDKSGIRTWELCYRIADTLDQYQMNRPEWISKWNELTEDDFDEYAQNPQFHGKVFKILQDMTPKSLRHSPTVDGQESYGIAPQIEQNVWQLKLWSMLRNNLKGYSKENSHEFQFLDRVQIVDAICKKLTDPDAAVLSKLPERIFIIGVSSLPTQVINFFQALGRHVQVYLMLVNPCREYWGDIPTGWHGLKSVQEILRSHTKTLKRKSPIATEGLELNQDLPESFYNQEGELEGGNALLTGLGRQGRDILSELLSLNPVPDFINCFVRPERNCVLNVLKDNLLTLNDSASYDIKDDDVSLSFCSCHTRRREVEVLRDCILQKFSEAHEKKEELLPRDILVMTPNIEQYAPHIEAVFGDRLSHPENYLPYSIGDRSIGRESPITKAVLDLMGIGTTPITLSFVISLLQVAEIRTAFSIAEDEVAVLESWCQSANIHWGLDTQEVKREAGVDDLPWSFERGLSRLLEGYMLGENDEGQLPVVEGMDAELLGRFCNFVRSLRELRDFFLSFEHEDLHLDDHGDADHRSIREKLRADFFERFVVKVREEDPDQASNFCKTLGGMCKILPRLKSVPKITLPVLRAMLSESFSNKVDETAYLRGSINFCSLMPMRAVPFKHIFILGLNELDFPRREHAPGFNLLTLSPFFKRGDRSRSVDDRYLFLEAILSSKESLTLSYIGQSPIEGTALNPSAVVSELYDYLEDNFTVAGGKDLSVRERLTFKACLNSYDKRNFMKEQSLHQLRHLPSFDRTAFIEDQRKKTRDWRKPLGAVSNFGIQLSSPITLDFASIFYMLSDPSRFFLHSLGIRFDNSDALYADHEDFALNFLTKNSFKEQSVYQQTDTLEWFKQLTLSGALPYGIFKKKNLNELEEFRSKSQASINRALLEYGMGLNDFQDPKRLPFDSSFIPISKLFSKEELALYHLPEDLEISFRDEAHFPCVIIDPYKKGVTRFKSVLKVAIKALSQSLCVDPHRPRQCALLCDSSSTIYTYQALDQQLAQDLLRQLLRFYLIGSVQPLPVWKKIVEHALKQYNSGHDCRISEIEKVSDISFEYDQEARYLFEHEELILQGFKHDEPNKNGELKIISALCQNFLDTLVKPYLSDPFKAIPDEAEA